MSTNEEEGSLGFGVSDESVVEYKVVVLPASSRRLREALEYTHKELMPLLSGPTGDYQWYREGFNLNVFMMNQIPCLYGTTDIGPCLEDEWSIVFLLKRLSEKFPDIWVQITDTDGEFLLIEAANALPNWLLPEISDNRIWLNNGEICIIPGDEFSGFAPTFREAVEYLRLGGSMYREGRITNEAFNRVIGYPQTAVDNSTHRTAVILPRKVGAILHKYPYYISAALELFNSRSLEDEKIVNKRSIFPSEDLVHTTVKFTRLQYAHTLGQSFERDNDDDNENRDERLEMGAKISAAMELLYADSLGRNFLTEDNVYDEPAFKDFLKDLSERGYFMGEVPGSDKYNDLRDLAVQPYLDSTKFQNEKGLFVQKASAIDLPSDQDILQWDRTVDSEKWLDAYLKENPDKQQGKDEGPEKRVEDMLQKVQAFMNDDSAGLDGINVYEENEKDASSSSSSSSSDAEQDKDSPLFGPDDPKIDEDDFLEFFLKEALKLSPEEIESYRTGRETEHNASTTEQDINDVLEGEEEEETKAMEEELTRAGILSNQDNTPDYNILNNLLQSIKSEGGVTGPAATLLGQMGIPVPSAEEFAQQGESAEQKSSNNSQPEKKQSSKSGNDLSSDDGEDDIYSNQWHKSNYDGNLRDLEKRVEANINKHGLDQ